MTKIARRSPPRRLSALGSFLSRHMIEKFSRFYHSFLVTILAFSGFLLPTLIIGDIFRVMRTIEVLSEMRRLSTSRTLTHGGRRNIV